MITAYISKVNVGVGARTLSVIEPPTLTALLSLVTTDLLFGRVTERALRGSTRGLAR